MAVSKRTRYEVLKRDNHTCRYCGATAPDAVLTVDHVTPVALGGSDDPSNLVAACQDCNAGKSSTAPDAEMVAQVSEDDLRWAAVVKRAAEQMEKQAKADKRRHDWFTKAWRKWDENGSSLPNGWRASLDCWLSAGLPKAVLLDCLDRAVLNQNVAHDDVFRYMGGIARKRIETLHEAARLLLDGEAADAS